MILEIWLIDWKRLPAYKSSKWYKDTVAFIWGDQGIAILLLSTYSVDYNFNMGGVDQHDQMRSYSSTQLISVRNWLPLFLFLLDAATICCFMRNFQEYQNTSSYLATGV